MSYCVLYWCLVSKQNKQEEAHLADDGFPFLGAKTQRKQLEESRLLAASPSQS